MDNHKKAFPNKYGGYGMDLRDYFAAKAIQGLLSNYEVTDRKGMASLCYEIADAMLKAREVQNG